MPTQKTDFSFTYDRGVAEAVDENPRFLLSIGYQIPGQIVAFISPQAHNEMAKQFLKNPNLDGVSIRASLSGLLDAALEYFEDEKAIDLWLQALEKAIGQLRDFKGERRTALQSSMCDHCAHPASDHYRPHVGDLNCNHADCGCSEFSPLVKPDGSYVPRPPLGTSQGTSRLGFSVARKV